MYRQSVRAFGCSREVEYSGRSLYFYARCEYVCTVLCIGLTRKEGKKNQLKEDEEKETKKQIYMYCTSYHYWKLHEYNGQSCMGVNGDANGDAVRKVVNRDRKFGGTKNLCM